MFGSCAEYHLDRLKRQRELEEQKQLEDQKKARESALQAENKLLHACKNGDTELVKTLLAEKVSIDCCLNAYVDYSRPDSNHWKQEFLGDAIHLAIKGDHPDILRMLLRCGVELISAKIELSTPDHPYLPEVAIPNQETLLSKLINIIDNKNSHYLKQHFRNLNRYGYTYLGFINERHQPLLIEAILLKSTKCAEMLVSEFHADLLTPYYRIREEYVGYSYKQKGNTVKLAVKLGLTKLALFMLKHEKFELSCKNEKIDRIDFLNSLLLSAANNNDYELVKYLLAEGVDPDAYCRIIENNKKFAMDLTSDKKIMDLLNDYDRATHQFKFKSSQGII